GVERGASRAATRVRRWDHEQEGQAQAAAPALARAAARAGGEGLQGEDALPRRARGAGGAGARATGVRPRQGRLPVRLLRRLAPRRPPTRALSLRGAAGRASWVSDAAAERGERPQVLVRPVAHLGVAQVPEREGHALVARSGGRARYHAHGGVEDAAVL